MIDYIVCFKPLLTGTRIFIKTFCIFSLVFGLLQHVGGILKTIFFTPLPLLRFQHHYRYWKDNLGCFRRPKPLCEWQEAVTTEMVCWALTSSESCYFCNGDAIFRWQPHMAQDEKVWESLLTVKIERGFFQQYVGIRRLNRMIKSYSYVPRLGVVRVESILENYYKLRAEIMDETLLFRLLQSHAPPLKFADRDYMRRLCKNYTFGAKLLAESLNIDVYFLMELRQLNWRLLKCPTFRKNYQFALILEAWRQEIQWCKLHIDENFDPALWHSILAFIAFPKGIDPSLISRHMRIPYR